MLPLPVLGSAFLSPALTCDVMSHVQARPLNKARLTNCLDPQHKLGTWSRPRMPSSERRFANCGATAAMAHSRSSSSGCPSGRCRSTPHGRFSCPAPNVLQTSTSESRIFPQGSHGPPPPQKPSHSAFCLVGVLAAHGAPEPVSPNGRQCAQQTLDIWRRFAPSAEDKAPHSTIQL